LCVLRVISKDPKHSSLLLCAAFLCSLLFSLLVLHPPRSTLLALHCKSHFSHDAHIPTHTRAQPPPPPPPPPPTNTNHAQPRLHLSHAPRCPPSPCLPHRHTVRQRARKYTKYVPAMWCAPSHPSLSTHTPHSMTTALRHKSTAPSHMHYNAKAKGFKEVKKKAWQMAGGG
jgi:hypothetical protein